MSTPSPHRLYIHLAWSTLARVPALDPTRRAAIETHVLACCRWMGAEPVEVCVLPDRVHLLVRVPATLSVRELAGRVRQDVEGFLADSGTVVRWAPGFAAVTVTPGEVRRTRKRIVGLAWGESVEPKGGERGPGVPRRREPGARGSERPRARGVQAPGGGEG